MSENGDEPDGYPDDDWTLGEARDWTRERAAAGVRCPLCGRNVKIWRRKINGAMVDVLAAVYLAGAADDYVHAPDVLPRLGGSHHGGDLAKLRYWGLVVELDEPREDGGRAGYWKVTPAGVAFLHGELAVPKYVPVFRGRRLGKPRGEPVTVSDCYGQPFRLDDLRAGI